MLKRYLLVALALGLASAAAPASAQHDDAVARAVDAVKDHFLHHQARYGAHPGDLASPTDLVVTSAYASRATGAVHVYLRQAHQGIPVHDATAQAAYAPDGRVVAPHARLVAGLAERVNATAPSLTAQAAAEALVAHLVRTGREWYRPGVIADTPGEWDVPAGYLTPESERAALVYAVTEGGAVRLSWSVEASARDGRHHFAARVDAETGRVLALEDLVDHDHWPSPSVAAVRAGAAAPSLAPLAPQPSPILAARAGGSSYNVWPLPMESPSHGPQTMANDPADPDASPLGWHDTGLDSYTITRGNNAYAYEDFNADNNPGFSPDGGPSLVFDFPFDPNLQPTDYQPLAVTSLFYWNNIMHDVMWHHGFDEPSGNFQANNGPNGGVGNDAVNAEAQDGSGIDNANFFTPAEGSPPRMQMYRWSPGAVLEVLSPPDIAGEYALASASGWGPPTFDLTEDVVQVIDADGNDFGCAEPFQNEADLVGKIALIQRGTCEFGTKALNAEEAGAVGVIIYNCEVGATDCSATSGEELVTMAPGVDGASVTIPPVFAQRRAGLDMLDHLPTPGVTAHLYTATVFRDSDLDAGIISHEYGHGVSNRLVGGPFNVGCLGNQEQMGEGWSDLFGAILTMRPGDTAGQRRGVGTYVEFQPNDGPGIRPAPYSTDPAINDFTYGDTRTAGQTGGLTVPHGIGFAWATIVWEALWELVHEHGFDPDIYDADGTAGNQVMLRLLVEGMKYTNCSPGFVDARNGILEADTLLYGGKYSDLLWIGFARRGLGFSATQGSSAINTDNTEAFDLPPGVGVEGGPEAPAAFRLSRAYPNPFEDEARFTLEVSEAQVVRVGVYDALGRRVAQLHDGALAAGTAHRFTVDGRGLASGTYFVRVTGETFDANERITILK